MTDTETKPLLVEATVHLPGGHAPGRRYLVDPRAEYIRDCIDAGYLVPVADEPVDPEPAETTGWWATLPPLPGGDG